MNSENSEIVLNVPYEKLPDLIEFLTMSLNMRSDCKLTAIPHGGEYEVF